MADSVAKVASFEGQAWAKSPNGSLRPLAVGDNVAADEVVVTAAGAHVELDFGDGHPVSIGGGQEVTMNRDLWTDLAADNKDAAIQDASVQEALTVLNNGGDLTDTLEETAAGLAGGAANDGHSFVQLSRLVEQTSPATLSTDLNGTAGTGTVENLASATPVNYAPQVAPQSFSGNEDTNITGQVQATDIENDVLSYSLAGQPANGTITLDAATGAFVYVPKANYNGPDSFVVTVTDDHGNATTTTVTLTVNPVNDAPVSADQNLTTPEDTPVVGQVVASDVEGDTLTYSLSTGAAHGTVTLDPATGAFVYTPSADYNGSDKFVVTIADGNGGFTTSTINIGVTPVNDAPVSADQNLTTPEDTPISGNVVATDVDGDTLAYSVTGAATHGTVTLNPATGAFTYTPNADYNGSDKFVVTIADGNGGFTTSTINIGVTPVNDAPVSADQNLTTPEDTPISSNVVATDVDGDTLAYSVTGAAIHGTVSLNPATGVFTYTPDASYNGSDKFVVTIADGNGGFTTSTINIGVTPVAAPIPVNTAPAAVDDSASTNQDTAVTIAVRGNDTDPDADPLTVSAVTQGANGSVVIDAVTGNPIYTPNTGFSGSDSFTYTINDGQGHTSTATVNLTVNAAPVVNQAPTAVDDSASTNQDTAVTIAVRGNDTDPDADPLTVSAVTQGTNGSVVIDAVTGNPIYTPNAGFSGSDSFTYTINDGNGHTSTATVSLTVNAAPVVNQAPTAVDDSASTNQDTAVTIAVRSNDTDPDADPLTVSAVTQGANGSVVIDAVTGNPIYTPNAGFSGSDSFTYTINDGQGHSSTATVSLTVNAAPVVNQAPTAVDDSASTDQDTAVTIAVRGNDTDPDADPLTVSAVTQGANGSVVIDAVTGNPIYTPNAGFSGSDSFTYTINDGQGHTSTATVNLTVNAAPVVNQAPTAVDDSATTDQDTAVTIAVRGNDTDPDADPLTVSAVTQGANGSVVIDAVTGNPIYTPNAGFSGSDSFTYTINDGQGHTSSATVSLTVNAVNHAPIAVDDAVSLNEDSSVTIAVRGNDTDSDADPLTVSAVTQGANGSVVIDAVTGNPIYTPNANFNGADSFTYTVSDGKGGTSTATVNVTVNPVNDAPVAADDSFTTNEDIPVTIHLGDLTANDSDVDGDAITVISAFNIQHGSLNLVGGNLVFTPDANYSGPASFQYGISDGHGGTDTATVNITVLPVNDPSVLVADTKSIDEDTSGIGNVLTNDSDVDDTLQVAGFSINGTDYNPGDTAVISGVGSLQLLANGDYAFTPVANYNGSVPVVTYTTNTGSSSTLTITVNPVNDAPVAHDDSFTTGYNQPLTITLGSLVANDTDIDGDSITVISALNIQHGSLNIVAGNLVFTPDANYNGPASFQYGISDGHGGTDTATVNINVLPAPGSLTLSATPDLTEAGGNLTYTASLTKVQGGDVQVTLANGEHITITAGQLSGSVTVAIAANEDVYLDPSVITNSIASSSGGDFGLQVDNSPVTTHVNDTIDTTSITLSAAASAVEGGAIVYTATLGNAVTGSPLVIHLSNGTDITIPVGSTSANSAAVAVRGDDAYVQGTQTVVVGISSTSGGNFEQLDTSSTATTVVSDNGTATSVNLSAAANVNEGGTVVYTATVGNAVTGSPLVIHLSNGSDITIPVGSTSASSAAVAVRGDDAYVQGAQAVVVGISSTSGGNFEQLNTSSTASTTVNDNGTTTSLSLTGVSSITEGASGSYTLNLSNLAQGDVTVTLNYTGVAANGSDFTGTTTVTIPSGSNSASFNIAALTDALTEGTENFTVSIGAASGGGFENLAINGAASSVTTSIIDVPANHAPVAVNDPSSAAYSVSLGDASASDLWTTLDSKGLAIGVNPYTTSGAAGTLYQGTVDGNANVIGASGSSPRTVPGTQVFQQIEYDQTTGKSETLELTFNGNLNQASFAVSRLFPGENGGEVGEWSAYYHGTLVASSSFRLMGTVDHGSFTINTGSLVFDSVKFTALNTVDGTGDGGDYFLTSFSGSGPASANTNYTLAEGSSLNINSASALKLLSNDTDSDGDTLSLTQINGVNVTDGQTVTLGSGASLVIHSDGSFNYATGNAFNSLSSGKLGTDTFTYTVSDGHGGTSTATATMTIIGKDLTGTSGNDVLVGGSYSEQIVGGKGNDNMTGGLGADTFKWALNDQGSKGTPAVDTITDFNKAQGDVLDLRDLLQNENSGNLTNYLHFTSDGTNTTVQISNTGSFDGSDAKYTSQTNQTIILTGVDLNGSDTGIINQLKNNGNLITD